MFPARTMVLLAVGLAPRAAGTYTVRWTAAADDVHPMKRRYTFVMTGAR